MNLRKKGFYELYIKRILDFFFSFSAFIVLSPFLGLVAILVKIKLGSPVLFIQKRPGKNGRLFSLYKFRTMRPPTSEMVDTNKDIERLSSFGKILRATSIDELPELINIIKGDMAIVGPRPLSSLYLPYYTKEERKRHNVRPGLTGLAQINGRNNLSWEEKFDYDIRYVNHVSLLQDTAILFKTVQKVLVREGIGQGEYVPVSLHVERKDWIITEDGAVKPNDVIKR